jgi:hypothetical protein
MLASICIRRIALGISSVGRGVIACAWPMEIGKPFYPKELELDVPDHCDCVIVAGTEATKKVDIHLLSQSYQQTFTSLVNSTRIARCV